MLRLLFYRLILAGALLAAGGCGTAGGTAAKQDVTMIRLQAAPASLQRDARQVLYRYRIELYDADGGANSAGGAGGGGGDALPLLRLSEKTTTRMASVAADGSIGGYKINYSLQYQFGDAPAGRITRDYEVDNDENRFYADRNQRVQLVQSLRLIALQQMLVFLQL